MTGNLLTPAAIVTLAQRGDACAMQQVARFRQQLARTLATIVNVVDPGVIVIGGGLSNVELLITALNASCSTGFHRSIHHSHCKSTARRQ